MRISRIRYMDHMRNSLTLQSDALYSSAAFHSNTCCGGFMKRRVVRMVLAAVALLMTNAASGFAAQNGDSYRAVINQYCISCHNDRLKTAGLSFEKLDFTNLAANADIWEKAVRKLRVGMMPPQGAAQPDGATRQSLVSW